MRYRNLLEARFKPREREREKRQPVVGGEGRTGPGHTHTANIYLYTTPKSNPIQPYYPIDELWSETQSPG
jgi:hypothetical protein